ncbi:MULTISPECIES: hypothetical protein [unclassified Maridesulfovibrio]|uniref:hypothetical protein n=1 Tax=unclassified Maridesulfovibrio TaxID=2794999 RepID=UPI003B3EBC6F
MGTSILTGKSSVQHAREMESLVKAKGYSTPSLTQDQPEDASVGKKSSAKNEQPKMEQYIAIGKFGIPQSLLTANVKKQQAKTSMLTTKEEGGVLDALGKMRDGFSTAVSRFADVFDTQGDDVINYGPYVSNETKDIMNKMAKQAHETGKKECAWRN